MMRVFVLSLLLSVLCGCSGSSNGGQEDLATGDLLGDLGVADGIGVDGASGDGVGADQAGNWPFDWCEPGVVPDDECFASRRFPESANVKLALELADAQIARHPVSGMKWNWEDAVLMISLTELYRVTGEKRLEDYYKAWIDYHIENGYSIKTSDTCVPAAVAVWLYKSTGEDKYRKVVEDALYYLDEVALRTEEGGISHLGDIQLVTLWVDSLFMFGSVLYGWGEVTGDEDVLGDYAEQYGIFAELLQDDSGFFTHAYDWISEQTPGVFWLRGNGWVAAAGATYLRVRALRGEGDEVVSDALLKLLGAAVGTQDASGFWWTIVNRPGETYLETSGTALFAFGLARAWRLGLVDDSVLPVVDSAMRAVRSKVVIAEDGLPVVAGTSGPTSADVFEVYANVPVEDDIGYGVGSVIFSLIETSGIPGVSIE